MNMPLQRSVRSKDRRCIGLSQQLGKFAYVSSTYSRYASSTCSCYPLQHGHASDTCSCCYVQVTDLVEGEIATATREVPRFATGGKGSARGGRSDAAARLASRQRLATKYSRFEAEVSHEGVQGQA
jgi:hypothetical protein